MQTKYHAKCTNDGKWSIVQHQMNVFDEKTNKYLYSSYFVLSAVSKLSQSQAKEPTKSFFSYVQKISFS